MASQGARDTLRFLRVTGGFAAVVAWLAQALLLPWHLALEPHAPETAASGHWAGAAARQTVPGPDDFPAPAVEPTGNHGDECSSHPASEHELASTARLSGIWNWDGAVPVAGRWRDEVVWTECFLGETRLDVVWVVANKVRSGSPRGPPLG